MPVDRFFHPRAGHSQKVGALSDLEFRVWWTYVLAADDYGVMRRSPVALQAANDTLARRPARIVERALDRLISVGLLTWFEHQSVSYVCQLDWQDFQKIRYPRESLEPMPPAEILEKCSAETHALFLKRFGNAAEKVPKSSGDSSEPLPHLQRAPAREEAKANGKWLTAQANGGEPIRMSLVPDAETERAGWLVQRYGELYAEHRHGARHRSRPTLDWSDACTMVPLWSNARLEKLAVLVLTTDDEWISKTDRSFKIFALKASWADDRLKQWEHEHGVVVAV